MVSVHKITNLTNHGINFKKVQPEQEEHSPDCFRDDELFDKTRDKADSRYLEYDLNDLPVYAYRKPIVKRKYLENYTLTDVPKYDIDTSKLDKEKYKKGYISIPNTPDNRLYRSTFMLTKKGYDFSTGIFEFLKEMRKEFVPGKGYFSSRELANLCELCKLKGQPYETFDSEMFKEGMYWAGRVGSFDENVAKILRSSVKKDAHGCEYFDFHRNEVLKNVEMDSELFNILINQE